MKDLDWVFKISHFSFRLWSPWSPAARASLLQEEWEGLGSTRCLLPCSLTLHCALLLVHFFLHLLLVHWKSDTTVIKNNSTKEIKATTIKDEKKKFQLMTFTWGDSPYREVKQYRRKFKRKIAPQSTKINFASWYDGLLNLFIVSQSLLADFVFLFPTFSCLPFLPIAPFGWLWFCGGLFCDY